MNIKINYTLNGTEGQVILFKQGIAAQVIANLAMRGATQIHVVGTKVEQQADMDTSALVEKFRMFINNE